MPLPILNKSYYFWILHIIFGRHLSKDYHYILETMKELI